MMPMALHDLLLISENPAFKNVSSGVRVAADLSAALDSLATEPVAAVVVDLDAENLDPLQCLDVMRIVGPAGAVFAATQQSHARLQVSAIAAGARLVVNFPQPCTSENLADGLRPVFDFLKAESHLSGTAIPEKDHGVAWVGADPQIRRLREQATLLGHFDSHFLISGEAGSGRTQLAKLICEHSQNSTFHILDASTAAKQTHADWLAEALAKYPGSPVILRHIESLSSAAQEVLLQSRFLGACRNNPARAKISMALTDKEAEQNDRRRSGSYVEDSLRKLTPSGRCQWNLQPKGYSDRLLATTALDVDGLIHDAGLHEDLVTLLSQSYLVVPPLRHRPGDIAALAVHFARLSEKSGAMLAADTLSVLASCPWPGNVAALRATIEALLSSVSVFPVRAQALPATILRHSFYRQLASEDDPATLPYAQAKDRAQKLFHQDYLASLLKRADGNLTVAAELAGMDRSNFKKIIRKYKTILP